MHDPSTAHGYFKCFDMQGNRILSSGRARASMQPLASFPCYQRPLTHTTDVLAGGSCTTENQAGKRRNLNSSKPCPVYLFGYSFPNSIEDV